MYLTAAQPVREASRAVPFKACFKHQASKAKTDLITED